MPVTSKELRKQIVQALQDYSGNNPEDYGAYMTACSVSWHLRDSPTGMSTINQNNMTALIHVMVSTLMEEREPDEILNRAHDLIHVLNDYIIKKLKDKGYISADDHQLNDDGLIAKHAEDFSAWADELGPVTGDETDK